MQIKIGIIEEEINEFIPYNNQINTDLHTDSKRFFFHLKVYGTLCQAIIFKFETSGFSSKSILRGENVVQDWKKGAK